MWYINKFGDLARIAKEEQVLHGVRTYMVGWEYRNRGGALNWDPWVVFSAGSHLPGHKATPLLFLDSLTKNCQVVDLIKKPTNKSATCSNSKGANYLLWLSWFQMQTLNKKKKKEPCVFNIPYQMRSPDTGLAALERSCRQSRCLIWFWHLDKAGW